ncbi:MAG: FAD-binding oxidoreductase [Pseudomonadota bacterium]
MTTTKPDVLVVGAGIFGLSVAWAAHYRGLRVRVLEADRIASGASGGVVGALSPHVPDQWNPKKQFQFEALSTAARHWAEVDRISGLTSGYGRTGRLMPLPSAEAAGRAAARAADATQNWGTVARWETVAGHSLIAPAQAPHGLIHETLSARLFPRAACLSLAQALRELGVEISEHTQITRVAQGRVETSAGPIAADQIVLAAGVPGFALMAPLLGQSTGVGVKGQAALLKAALPPDTPIFFHDGLYVIPHAEGMVAVGSTSENRFDDATTTDQQLDTLLARAAVLCPALTGAEVIQRWAGVRPKARRRDPMLGPVPGHPGVFAATGAFKIGFGIAHKVGESLADMLTGQPPDLPPSFAVAHHMETVPSA